MRHLKSGKKLGRTRSHRKALMNSLATALFEHKKIHTTEAKAKALRPFAEKIISRAKFALQREKQGLLSEGQTIDVHSRREVGKLIKNKAVLQELFDTIAPTVVDRNGGYTRIVKTGYRLGDAGAKAIIELVDWSNPQDGPTSKKKKKKSAPKSVAPVDIPPLPAQIEAEAVTAAAEQSADLVENVVEKTEDAVETVTEKAKDVIEAVSDKIEDTVENTVDVAENVIEKIEDTISSDSSEDKPSDEDKKDDDKKAE